MRLKKIFKSVLVAVLPLLAAACTPPSPLSVSPRPVSGGLDIVGNVNGPVITAVIDSRHCAIACVVGGIGSLSCKVWAADADGNPLPITSASLLLPGGGTVPLVQYPPYPGTPPHFADYSMTWPYLGGQPYTVNVTIGGSTYSATTVAPGGGFNIPPFASGGGPITWINPGNADRFVIHYNYNNTVPIFNIDPATSGTLSTASATYFPASGFYRMHLCIRRENNSGAFGPGAHPDSKMYIEEQYQNDDVK